MMRIKLKDVENETSSKATRNWKISTTYKSVLSWMNTRRWLSGIIVGLVIFTVAGLYVYGKFIAKPVTSVDVQTSTPTQEGQPQTENNLAQAQTDLQSMIVPVDGDLVTVFGFTFSSGLGDYRYHSGIDLAAPDGSPVAAALAGKVISVSYTLDDAYRVTIDHGNGWATSYSQLSAVIVAPGQSVRTGEELGRVDNPGLAESSTGPHLHFELREKDEPRDPMFYLKQLKPVTAQ
ncbi:MAG: peptidoglycan DD-metalloendopeptidase family protein [Bacillota bacterium]